MKTIYFGLFFFAAQLTALFSATILSSTKASAIADQGPMGAREATDPGVPSFDITESNKYVCYWGIITVQSDPGIPILNAFLRFQSNPDQPDIDVHFRSIGTYQGTGWGGSDSDNLREIYGTNLGNVTTETGLANIWEIPWHASPSTDLWLGRSPYFTYQTIQGTATLIIETSAGSLEFASYPFLYTGATLVPVPEASIIGFIAFPCLALALRRSRAA